MPRRTTPRQRKLVPSGIYVRRDGNTVEPSALLRLEEMTRHLTWFLNTRLESWRRCPERSCKRARSCILPKDKCGGARPPRPSTPQRDRQLLFVNRRLLEKELARNEAKRTAEQQAQSAAATPPRSRSRSRS